MFYCFSDAYRNKGMRNFQQGGQKNWLWNGQANFNEFQYQPKPFSGPKQNNGYNRPQNNRSFENGKFKPKDFNNKDDKKSWSSSSDEGKETPDSGALMVRMNLIFFPKLQCRFFM